MNCFLLSAVLFFPIFAQESTQPDKDAKIGKARNYKVDGEWTTTYMEMDGKKVEIQKSATVTIKNNVVTCQHDGKQMSWRLEFGPHNMVRATEQSATSSTEGDEKKRSHTHYGTYIASQEYFCLCLHKGADKRFPDRKERNERGDQKEAKERENGQGTGSFEGHQPHGANMVIILRRAGGSIEKTP